MSNVTRWNPLDEFPPAWPRLFGRDFFARLRPGGELAMEWSPRCDVEETDAEVIVHAELPGVEAKDMEVSIAGSQLTIRGEKQTQRSEENEGRTYQERFFGSFERSIPLPPGVDADNIAANLKDGVLEVRIPRVAPPAPEKKTVNIATG
ncbi:MAG: Hsp20/alpha crystallin family protein [Dehalococcoidia bacterium]|nr:Hsp20/alpha crystallin family protein [Dehalococcoidia bacterium]